MNDHIMKFIFSGTGIKTSDGVNLILSGGNNFNLRSSKCEITFLRNDSSRCKHCRLLIKKVYNIINRSSPPTTKAAYVMLTKTILASYQLLDDLVLELTCPGDPLIVRSYFPEKKSELRIVKTPTSLHT